METVCNELTHFTQASPFFCNTFFPPKKAPDSHGGNGNLMFGWIISERVLGFRFSLGGFVLLSNPDKKSVRERKKSAEDSAPKRKSVQFDEVWGMWVVGFKIGSPKKVGASVGRGSSGPPFSPYGKMHFFEQKLFSSQVHEMVVFFFK